MIGPSNINFQNMDKTAPLKQNAQIKHRNLTGALNQDTFVRFTGSIDKFDVMNLMSNTLDGPHEMVFLENNDGQPAKITFSHADRSFELKRETVRQKKPANLFHISTWRAYEEVSVYTLTYSERYKKPVTFQISQVEAKNLIQRVKNRMIDKILKHHRLGKDVEEFLIDILKGTNKDDIIWEKIDSGVLKGRKGMFDIRIENLDKTPCIAIRDWHEKTFLRFRPEGRQESELFEKLVNYAKLIAEYDEICEERTQLNAKLKEEKWPPQEEQKEREVIAAKLAQIEATESLIIQNREILRERLHRDFPRHFPAPKPQETSTQ